MHAHRYYDVPPRLRNVIKDEGWHIASAGPVVLNKQLVSKIPKVIPFWILVLKKAARASSRWPIIFGDLQRTRFFVESSVRDTLHNTTTVLLRLQSRDVFADIQYSPINCTCCYVDISPIFSPYFFLVHRFLLNHLWWTIIRISLPKQQRLQ